MKKLIFFLTFMCTLSVGATEVIFIKPCLSTQHEAKFVTDERLHTDYMDSERTPAERHDILHDSHVERFMKGPGCRGGCAAAGAMIGIGAEMPMLGGAIVWGCSETCQNKCDGPLIDMDSDYYDAKPLFDDEEN